MIKVRVKSFECATPCLIIDHLIQHTWSVVVKVEPLEILSRPRPLLYLHLVSKYKQCCQIVVQKIVELDWVYPNSKLDEFELFFQTWTRKKPDLKRLPKPKLEKNLKIETRSNSILNYWNFAKEMMHFGQILVKFFSQTRKMENSTSFGLIFWNPKTWTRKV